MSKLVFIDTETTSLRHDRRAWEIGLIVRGVGHPLDAEHHWFIDPADLDLGNADVMSLKIGKFYDRHPHGKGAVGGFDSEAAALKRVESLTRGAHLVGAVPNFDADVLSARMRANGICPSWHYHLIDVEALMVGYLAAKGQWPGPGVNELDALPWKSDDLAAAVGVLIREGDRHTALGDARWARDIYDAVTGGAR
jgi:DNA polymerase III epsilon subunit-like protein